LELLYQLYEVPAAVDRGYLPFRRAASAFMGWQLRRGLLNPESYLTGWRLALAADLLLEPDTTLEAVARRVGYSSDFALSAAFKRVWGESPQEYRRRRGLPVPSPSPVPAAR
jgi:AraC-like DNA-binding protein